MNQRRFSLILLPTLRCNADCAYCFEEKPAVDLGLDGLAIIVGKLMDYVEQERYDSAMIHWQGGEVMTLDAEWLERAHAVVAELASARGIRVDHGLQSNLIGYTPGWNRVLGEMFGNQVGTSLDFPNLHRRIAGGTAADYDRIWLRNVRAVRAAGIHVGVIAIPSPETLDLGAERFYERFVDELGIVDFQINTPFAGGPADAVKRAFPLDPHRLGRFLIDLADIWMSRGRRAGVKIGPFDELLRHFTGRPAALPCLWRDNCAHEFVCIDPRGWVAQCDCWVASYPDHRFGNIFGEESLAQLLERSPARRRLLHRPSELIRREDCIACEHLAICHGGCPIRAFTHRANLNEKDPYCETYRMVFDRMRTMS